MNPGCSHPELDLWSPKAWEGRRSPLAGYTDWVLQTDHSADTPVEDGLYAGRECPDWYSNKTCSMNVPEVVAYWAQRGMEYRDWEIGGFRWISMVPGKALQNPEHKIPALLVFHVENYASPYWAMHTLTLYHDLNLKAAREQFAVLYLTTKAGVPFQFAGMINEGTDLFPIDPHALYLDVSLAEGLGVSLKEAGLDLPQKAVVSFGGGAAPAVNVSKLWPSRGDSWLYMLRNSSADIDPHRFIHSQQGRMIARDARVEHDYTGIEDPALLAYWKDLGVEVTCHDFRGDRWVSVVPKEPAPNPLPLFAVFQEVNYANDLYVLSACAQYQELIRLVARGELALLFFARETLPGNDRMAYLICEMERLYAIDPGRVYVTGHSHNGNHAAAFARRHPDLVAALVCMGDQPGVPRPADCVEPVQVTDDMVEEMRTQRIPTAVISGMCESGCYFPIARDADNVRPGVDCPQTEGEARLRSWNRRLYAHGLSGITMEEARNSLTSRDPVRRNLGIPCDHTSIRSLYGFDHYIADFLDEEGSLVLRIVACENAPHMTVPSALALAWDFVRRFARVDGKIVEIPQDRA